MCQALSEACSDLFVHLSAVAGGMEGDATV